MNLTASSDTIALASCTTFRHRIFDKMLEKVKIYLNNFTSMARKKEGNIAFARLCTIPQSIDFIP